MDTTFSRAQRSRRRAEEIRKTADGVTDPECQRTLLLLASRYDQLADRLFASDDDEPEPAPT